MRYRTLLVAAALAVTANPSPMDAQLADACPGIAEGEGALIGHVTDPELGGMPMFGAVVTATWDVDGETRSAEYTVPDDGVYLICGVRIGARVTLSANFSGRESEPVEVRMDKPAKQQDLTVYLSGSERPEHAPLVIGPDSSGRCADLQAPQLVQCYNFDECRYNRVGNVRARRVGLTGNDNRELVETFVRNARQRAVDAVRDVRAEYEQRGLEIVLVMIEGTGVEFTEERCKRWAANPDPV